MTKYLISRILRALISVIIVVGVIMVMVYTFLNKQSIFATDPVFTKQKLNGKETYMMQQWELFGYLDYVNYTDFLKQERSIPVIAVEKIREILHKMLFCSNDRNGGIRSCPFISFIQCVSVKSHMR